MQQFSEISSIFIFDNITNEANLRDFLIFLNYQYQKRNNSARHPWKMENWMQSWRPHINIFCNFPPPQKNSGHTKYCPCHAKWPLQVWKFDAPKYHLSQEINVRTSLTAPMNISLDISCIAPATEITSLIILFKYPVPAHVLLNFDQLHNPLRLPRETISECPKEVRTPGIFLTLISKYISRYNDVHFFDISISKSGPNMRYFQLFHLQIRFCSW